VYSVSNISDIILLVRYLWCIYDVILFVAFTAVHIVIHQTFIMTSSSMYANYC